MAGPIQGAISGAVTATAGAAIADKKMYEEKEQAAEKASAKAEAEAKAERALQEEGKEIALEADLIRMGGDPKSVEAFMTARQLGLDTKSFGMIRKQGKFVGSYSSLAEKLSKDGVTDSLSSKVLNKEGFARRLAMLSGKHRIEKAQAAVGASEGGKK